MVYKPPFKITSLILTLSGEISRELGILTGAKLNRFPIRLRKANSIRTIHASLSIEGNTLSLNQVTSLFEGERVLGPKKDIIEVQNSINAYKNLQSYNYGSINSLLSAHKKLMEGLIPLSGEWRREGVGIFKGDQVAHIAPSAKRVPTLMHQVFTFLKKDKETSWLLKACIFHYELEFIHPFSDGNGRAGRLWQQVILMKEDPIFEYISVEELIKDNQKKYYNVLSACDKEGESTKFIEFMLEKILSTLRSYVQNTSSIINDVDSRLDHARLTLKNKWFSRKDYILLQKDISSATASRDLSYGIQKDILVQEGEKNQAKYFFNPTR